MMDEYLRFILLGSVCLLVVAFFLRGLESVKAESIKVRRRLVLAQVVVSGCFVLVLCVLEVLKVWKIGLLELVFGLWVIRVVFDRIYHRYVQTYPNVDFEKMKRQL